MARLIRVIQSLPADRLGSLGHSLGVAEAGITAGELARRIYHLLSDRAGIERVLTQLSTKDRLVLMMIASSPQGRSNISRLGAEAPFSAEELSAIVDRLVNHALVQVSPPADLTSPQIETPVEIRSLLRTGANRHHGRVAEGPKQRPVGRMFPAADGASFRTPESAGPAERARRSGDPVSEITDWARQTQADESVGTTRKGRPSRAVLADVLGLWESGDPSRPRIGRWLALSDDERRTIALRAWLHHNDLTFGDRIANDVPARRLVRMALVALLARGVSLSDSGMPQQIEKGLRMLGLDLPVTIPRSRQRLIVQSVLRDLDLVGTIMRADEGSYEVASPSMQRVCANAVEIGAD